MKGTLLNTLEAIRCFFTKVDVKRSFHPNGQLSVKGLFANGKLHREDEPAIQHWYDNGQKQYEQWFFNGKTHRFNGPAFQHWTEDGQKHCEAWWINGTEFTKKQYDEAMELYNKSELLFNLKYRGV